MKTSFYAAVVATLLLVVWGTPASSNDLNVNCSSDGTCEGDEAPCPPDSAPALGPDGGPCLCSPLHCNQPVCRYGLHKVLQRIGSGKPGDCCDIYECVAPKEKNCSDVVCPEDAECPPDSYRLPSHKAPDDCCSVAQGCQCLPGPCQAASCPQGEREREVRPGTGKPGACCPLIECLQPDTNDTCSVDGKITNNGSTWWKDECTRCRCNNGLIFCAISPSCPDLEESCTATRIPPGQCCPVCDVFATDSCVSAFGKIIPNGETWQEDPCTTCTCVGGTKGCRAYMCEACFNPTYVEGECCPVCNGSYVVTLPPHCPAFNNCSLRCMHGFKRDQDGCFSCECQAEQCLLVCPSGYAQDQHGNKLCECAHASTVAPPADCPPLTNCRKTCPHGFRLNKLGCEICKCSQCRPLECDKNCPHGHKTNDRGCPICKCQAAGQSKLDDNLNSATSQNGTDLTCTTTDGQSRGDGEAWFDGCRQCYCHAGVEMCNLITCPQPKCKDPVFNSKTGCCPQCPGASFDAPHQMTHSVMLCQSVDGSYRVEGETWQLNTCTQCLCHAGRVLCQARQCQPTPCSNPVVPSDQCCPQCPSTKMAVSGSSCEKGHIHGSSWQEGNCRSCSCNLGRTECFNYECPAINCDHPVLAKNWCCPLCLDQSKPKVCEVGNTTYHASEMWNEDACTQCVCRDGTHYCTEKVCSVACTNPIKKPGKCCPVCKPEPSSSLGLFKETTYLIVMCVLFCVSAFLVLYCGRRQCRRRRQADLDDVPSTHSYNNYSAHTPPPNYTSADRRDPYQYKYSQPYDAAHIDGLLKSPEKMALAPV